MFTKSFNIKKLSKITKEKLYNKLLNCKLYMRITVYKRDNIINADVLFRHNDLCVLSFYHNFFFRTEKACKKERYKTFGEAIFNLKRILKEYNMYIQNVQIYDKNNKKLLYRIVV